jgi:hypothetical protein
MASHSAIASRPARASDIKYAVIWILSLLPGAHREGSDGGALADASCDKALTWGDAASRMRPPPDSKFRVKPRMQKARGRFPGAGSIVAVNSCETDNVPVICPTCQIFLSPALARRRNLSAAREFA